MGLKTYDYIVVLKPNINYRAINWISQLLIFIGILFLGYCLLVHPKQQERILIGALIVFLTGSWFFSKKKNKFSNTLLWMGVALSIGNRTAAIVTPGIGIHFIAGYAIAALLEWQIKFKQEIGFDNEGIAINSFPKKTYQWHEVSNVVLKDDIITVDLYNNKIIQREIDSEIDDETEIEFNDFCRSHLLSV